MREKLEYYFEETSLIKKWRGKDIFKAKIKYIINKYYYDKPIYIFYFKRYGKYQKIRKTLEELVREEFLIKFKDTRPVYYLKKKVCFSTADKL